MRKKKLLGSFMIPDITLDWFAFFAARELLSCGNTVLEGPPWLMMVPPTIKLKRLINNLNLLNLTYLWISILQDAPVVGHA